MSAMLKTAAIVTASSLLTAGVAAAAPPLHPLLWQNRPLLIFAANAGDPELARQRAIVARHRTGLQERDMVVFEIVGDQVRAVIGAAPAASAAAFRRYYRVGTTEFRAILVGKDGGSKLRQSTPVDSDRLFRLIDSMPMRRDEMRRRG